MASDRELRTGGFSREWPGLMRRLLLPLAALVLAGAAPAERMPPVGTGTPPDFLLWSQPQREVGFRNMDKLYPTAVVRRGKTVHPLPMAARQVDIRYSVAGVPMDADRFMDTRHMSGLLILKDGKIVLERYRHGFSADQRWTPFSVAKSFTSTLIGAAVRDGFIKSIDDPVTRYIPQMKGSAYDRVSIRHLMMMASGIRWDEGVEDYHSDYARLFAQDFVAPMIDRPLVHPPGTVFYYDTADANLAGLVVQQATGKPISQYLSEKIWAPYGMEQDAAWLLVHGKETGGACLSMTLRDYGRFGEFIRGGGLIDGQPVLADGWLKDATRSHIATGWGSVGYGYFWWVNKDETFRALGVFGQLIFIDVPHKLVVVGLGAWDHADRNEGYVAEDAFLAAVEKSVAGQP